MRQPNAGLDSASSTDRPANPSRRRLLQKGAAGMTAALAARASVGAAQQQTAPPPPQGPPALIPATPPAATGIVDRFESLSEREREIFQLIAEAHSNKAIADLLSISPATVETHRAQLIDILGVKSSTHAIRIAVEADFIGNRAN